MYRLVLLGLVAGLTVNAQELKNDVSSQRLSKKANAHCKCRARETINGPTLATYSSSTACPYTTPSVLATATLSDSPYSLVVSPTTLLSLTPTIYSPMTVLYTTPPSASATVVDSLCSSKPSQMPTPTPTPEWDMVPSSIHHADPSPLGAATPYSASAPESLSPSPVGIERASNGVPSFSTQHTFHQN